MKLQRLFIYLFVLLVSATGAAYDKNVGPIEEYDLLGLDSGLKEILDEQIKPLRPKKRRLRALHKLLYFPENFGIRYQSGETKTAMETFNDRHGNCVSLSNLFIATARYVGLDAKYQSVRVDRTWYPQDGFYEVPGHMNVIVEIGWEIATIEFNAAFFENPRARKFDTKVMSDSEATAEFYNNIGADKLGEKKPHEAIAYFLKGLEFNRKLDFLWSNLGVAYKQSGNLEEAEKSYVKAIKLNKYNYSTISNIYILYNQLNKQSKSKIYAEKAEKYARKNPYFLAKIADKYIQNHDYKNAIKLLKSAIRIFKQEPQFHHALSVAYYYQKDIRRSQKALKRAIKYSDDINKLRYQQKMQKLAKLL